MTTPIDREGGVRVSQAAREAKEALAFLFGQGPLEGVWFHEQHPRRKGAFWWRTVMRERGIAPDVDLAARFEAQAQAELVEALRAICELRWDSMTQGCDAMIAAKRIARQALARIEGGDQ
jgi:hypothetical protein